MQIFVISKLDRFTSNQDQSDQRPILHCVPKNM